jgi:hypothetical protein
MAGGRTGCGPSVAEGPCVRDDRAVGIGRARPVEADRREGQGRLVRAGAGIGRLIRRRRRRRAARGGRRRGT